jgi:hypothetical protein
MERPIRIILGVILIGIAAFGDLTGVAMGVVMAAGAIALITGAIGYCPLWTLLGINTCPTTTAGKKA